MKATEIGGNGHDAERQQQEKKVAAAAGGALSGALTALMAIVGITHAMPEGAFWGEFAGQLQAAVLPAMLTAASVAAALAVADLQAVVHVGVDMAPVTAAINAWAGKYAAELVKGITSNTRDATGAVIQNWLTSGGDMTDLNKLLAPLFGADRARLIAATEVTRVFAEANHEVWNESHVIMAREWRTANDEIVCDICGGLDNVQVLLDAPFEYGGEEYDDPPAHPNCRCWIVPVIRESRR